MSLVAPETTKFQYTDGVADVSRISPDNWVHDQALLDRPGNAEIQMDLFYDYRTNLPLYPAVQAYFRKHQPPTLIVWGKNDKIFPADGAYPYKRDLPDVEFHLHRHRPFRAGGQARRDGAADPRLSEPQDSLASPALLKGAKMFTTLDCAVVLAASTIFAATSFAQSAKDIRGPSPLVAIEDQPPARLIVDPPLAKQLEQGLVFIQYAAENLHIVPVFGKGALDVSPRIGHVHITVDDAPWHFVDASGETVIVVGLKPGPHNVLFELADPTHHVIDSKTVSFEIPPKEAPR